MPPRPKNKGNVPRETTSPSEAALATPAKPPAPLTSAVPRSRQLSNGNPAARRYHNNGRRRKTHPSPSSGSPSTRPVEPTSSMPPPPGSLSEITENPAFANCCESFDYDKWLQDALSSSVDRHFDLLRDHLATPYHFNQQTRDSAPGEPALEFLEPTFNDRDRDLLDCLYTSLRHRVVWLERLLMYLRSHTEVGRPRDVSFLFNSSSAYSVKPVPLLIDNEPALSTANHPKVTAHSDALAYQYYDVFAQSVSDSSTSTSS